MTIAVKVLGNGQLPSSKGTLYTVPGSTKAFIKFLSVCNVGANTETITILVNATGTSRRIALVTLGPDESARVIDKDETLNLEAGDLLEGFSTHATSVDYVVTGAEEA